MPDAAALLEELLIPQTPPSVKAAYEGLAEEATTRAFGLLEEDIVILDTETTGLSFRRDALIEIAAVKLQGREAVGSFQTFVDPARPIPEEITQLTGITDDDVEGAPPPERAVRDLAAFVGGLPVVAHNATFDRTFIEQVPGGTEVTDTWIDSLMLSRIALPRLKSHALARMAAAFGIRPVTHRAMADVEALSGMWRVILCGLSHLPTGFLGALADAHPEVEWPYRPIFRQLALEEGEAPFSLLSVRKELVGSVNRQKRLDARELGHLTAPFAEIIEEAFTETGLVGSLYESFEQRSDQLAMALEVREALEESTHRAIEAATGTGKSMAYLVPLALFAKENRITCGIATKTNALTDQLVSSELPALDESLRAHAEEWGLPAGGLSYASLKGYDHYPCLRRVERALSWDLPEPNATRDRAPATVQADLLNAIAVTMACACQSAEGDLDSLGIRWKFVPRGMLTTTPDECLHRRCPYYPSYCLLHGARQRAQSADILVTNHSLLLRDVEAEGKILPPVRHWVVDEAQGFEGEAREQWALEASAFGVRQTLERLGGLRTGAIHALMVQAGAIDGARLVQGLLTRASSEASRIATLTADLFDDVLDVVRSKVRKSSYDSVELRVDDALRELPAFGALADTANELAQALDTLLVHLKDAQRAVDEALDVPTGDIEGPRRELARLREVLKLVFEQPDGDRFAFVSASLAGSRRGYEKIAVATFDIGAELAERWYPEMETVIYCSGTLALGDDFSRFCHGAGLDRLDSDSARTLALRSSYDFDSAMQVVVAKGLPEPGAPDYIRRLVDFLFDLHVAMDGSVLTLFTNRKDMEKVYRQLRPRLEREQIPLLVQDRGVNVRRLRERFVEDERTSLLALRSFWEGIDAAGDTLRCVVVPKLPFASPADPLTQEREARDEHAWSHYSLPDAVLLLKQAAGRLIRSSTDVGVLVLADERIRTRRYGRAVVSAMPSESVAEVSVEAMPRFIHSWRIGRGR